MLRRKVEKVCRILLEKEIDRSHRTITMLGYDEFCHILLFRIRIIVIVTIDEADNIGILFEAPDSRRSLSIGRLLVRDSTLRLS